MSVTKAEIKAKKKRHQDEQEELFEKKAQELYFKHYHDLVSQDKSKVRLAAIPNEIMKPGRGSNSPSSMARIKSSGRGNKINCRATLDGEHH
jgi:hypothetical protein